MILDYCQVCFNNIATRSHGTHGFWNPIESAGIRYKMKYSINNNIPKSYEKGDVKECMNNIKHFIIGNF